MTFHVDASGLRGLPAQLDRLSEDAAKGGDYVTGKAKMSYRDAGQCSALQGGGEGPGWEGRQARAVP